MEKSFNEKARLYIKNELPKEDKEVFEKELANNKILADAVEGLRIIGIEKDQEAQLKFEARIKKIIEIKKRNRKIIRLSIAVSSVAAAIVLVIILTKPEQILYKPRIAEVDNNAPKENPIAQEKNNVVIDTSISIIKETPLENPSKQLQKEHILTQKKYASSSNVKVEKPDNNNSRTLTKSNRVKPTKPENFDAYLKNNVIYPESKKGSTISCKVVLEILVLADGSIGDNIKIVSDLNPDFDKEAKRALKNSPKWLPAIENEKPIDKTTLVIVEFNE